MAYLDFLVDPGRKPSLGTVWIYTMDMVWKDGHFGDLPTAKDRLVHRLERYSSGYRFEFLDEPGQIYHCSYTWAFVQDTSRNCALYRWRKFVRRIIARLEQHDEGLTARLDTLALKKKSEEAGDGEV